MEKYTVIIPTRDRAETLEATLKTCLRQTYKNFEIIVSDNCSVDNTQEIVYQCNDPRIRYINPGRRLSMAGNFEFALGHVADGFVMFIGSDDGIMPGTIEYVDSIAKKFHVDAVSCSQATYIWPDFPDEQIAGRLAFGGVRKDVEVRKSSEWIEKTLNFQTPYCFDLPNLYCGFVHKRVIDKAYKDGRYFRSITPDAYSAFATAIFIDRYAFSYRPFVIAGASIKSNGASAIHPSASSSESVKFFQENDIDFFDGFVNCPSYEIIAAETYAQLEKAFPDRCSSYQINYKAMFSAALKNSNERTEKAIKDAIASMAINFGIEPGGGGVKRRFGSSYLLGALKRIFISLIFPRTVAIERSTDVGVKDVDDAALVAHALIESSACKFTTTRTLVKERLKRIIKF